jgi:hypothetical protein
LRVFSSGREEGEEVKMVIRRSGARAPSVFLPSSSTPTSDQSSTFTFDPGRDAINAASCCFIK